MKDDATLVIVVGYLGASEREETQKAMASIKAINEANGSQVQVIGDGTYAPSLEEIRTRIASIPTAVEVIVAAHGERMLPDSGYPDLGKYTVTLSGNQTTGSPEIVGALPDGSPVAHNQLANIEDVFRAMPSNVKGLMLNACYSEAALSSVHLLADGTRLFVGARENDTMSANAGNVISTYAQTRGVVADGSGLTEAYGAFLATFNNTVHYTNGAPSDHRQTPTTFAISGEGAINLEEAAQNLKGYPFPEAVSAMIVENMRPNATAEDRARMISSFNTLGARITNGELGASQGQDNRAYNFVLTEMARVANERGLPISQALEWMQGQAAQARAGIGSLQPIVEEPNISAVCDVKALGESLRSQMPACMWQNGNNAEVVANAVAVPISAQTNVRAASSEIGLR